MLGDSKDVVHCSSARCHALQMKRKKRKRKSGGEQRGEERQEDEREDFSLAPRLSVSAPSDTFIQKRDTYLSIRLHGSKAGDHAQRLTTIRAEEQIRMMYIVLR